MLNGRFRPRRRPLLPVLLLAASAVLLPSCASGGAALGLVTLSWPGALPSAVDAVLGAAPACGLKLTDARREEAEGSATLVFLDEWQSPKPESALVTVRFGPAPGGVSCRVEAHPLAEYGMLPPDVTAGSEGLVCKPCSEAQKGFTMVKYSRGQAMANSARASRCLGEALGEAASRER
ncbi:MAG TPA: hypothetical protein VE129_01270 [Thermoanaerobaculia bacterium]|nr:hypothetical protein [Thermoanaerobaculia bacterium]